MGQQVTANAFSAQEETAPRYERGNDPRSAKTMFTPAPLDTHWSRILHCDVFAEDTDSSRPHPSEIAGIRTVVRTGTVLLGVSAALYLAFAGVVYVSAAPDAVAAVLAGAITPTACHIQPTAMA
jgi:hypothetical protein